MNHKYIQYFLVGTAIFSAAGLLLWQFFKMKPSPRHVSRLLTTEMLDKALTKPNVYSEYYFDRDKVVADILSFLSDEPTVEDIFLNSPLLVSDEFTKYTKQIRKSNNFPDIGRRLIRKVNEKMYIKILMTYNS